MFEEHFRFPTLTIDPLLVELLFQLVFLLRQHFVQVVTCYVLSASLIGFVEALSVLLQYFERFYFNPFFRTMGLLIYSVSALVCEGCKLLPLL